MMGGRILVDCNLVDFTRQPTGIPRVVMKYLQIGYEWGLSNDYAIVPVVPSADGLWVVRPLPSWLSNEHRQSLEKYDRENKPEKFSFLKRKIKVEPAKIVIDERDIVFSPAYWHDVEPAIYRNLKSQGAFLVTLVHDLLPIIFAKCYNSPWRDAFKTNAIATIEHSDLILTVSGYTLSAVKELALRNRKKMPRSAIAYNGFEALTEMPHPTASSYIGSRRLAALLNQILPPLLMVGSIEPKKAHIPVILALEQMWDAGYDRPLVIVGRRGWLEQPTISKIEGCRYYKDKLFWFDDLDDTDLALCYRRGHALLFASIGEGFGIPMIEASHYGMPVIVYDTEIAREVLGASGLYFSSQKQFVDAILQMEKTEDHLQASADAKAVSWPIWETVANTAFDLMARSALDHRIRKAGNAGDDTARQVFFSKPAKTSSLKH